jgi:PAS domain S-box-containing protein
VGEQAVHILLVGGDPAELGLVRNILRHLMGKGTTRLDHSSSIPEALQRLVRRSYDLLLVDEQVQGKSGLDLLRNLRRQRRVLPLVFLTGTAGEQSGLTAMRAGASDYLYKPGINELNLAKTIRCALCLRRRESESRQAEHQLRVLSRAVEQSADLVIITGRDGRIEYVNPAFTTLTGYNPAEVIGHNPRLLKSSQQDPVYYKELWDTILAGRVFRGVLINKKKNGELFHAEKTITPVRDSSGNITHFISNDRDITERRRLEAELLQSQKMDAVGQLAGGVAHDFNNLLMVISSYAELALDSLTPEHALHRNLQEILAAARRAADLTRQLLAFSRKQMQSLRVLDLNAVLQEIGRMLPRLIGEDIQLSLIPGKDLGQVRADPVQIEQIIMNLAANARDAMPNGGTLTLATSNLHLDEEYVHRRPIMPAGEYVLLSVTDSGCGIPAEHLQHIFEPFFTTKEKGKGTGLGLATVYGIVKQNGGFIWVYSETGLGTTFNIYLPRIAAPAKKRELPARTTGHIGGSETLLLVEDEAAVRCPASEFLKHCGYTVLEARDGKDAILVAHAHKGTIHLLVTDVVMPHLSGSQVAEQLSRERPDLKVLYVSGYASPMLLQHGITGCEAMLLQKPFTLKMLAWKVREALSPQTQVKVARASTT